MNLEWSFLQESFAVGNCGSYYRLLFFLLRLEELSNRPSLLLFAVFEVVGMHIEFFGWFHSSAAQLGKVRLTFILLLMIALLN